MDKILAFSILSSSPADIACSSGYSTRLSWRSGGAGAGGKQAEKATKKPVEKVEQNSPPERKQETRAARFAPEFDGINCFDSIVLF